MKNLLLKNGWLVSPENNLSGKNDIKIENGVITEIAPEIEAGDCEVIDCGGMIVAPAFVELHSHMREPGFEDKETLETGLGAALKGGYGVVCAMANTNPVVDNEEVFEYVQKKAKEVSPVEFHQVCAVTKGLTSNILTDFELLHKKGAIAFSNDGKPIEDMELLKKALEVAKESDVLIMLHSEVSELASGGVINEGKTSSAMGLKGIPNEAESEAVRRELGAIRAVDGARAHFCHISTRQSIELIRQAKKEGLCVTAETAPHYFSLSDEDITSKDARFKMNPPLRSKEDVEAIIEGIVDGTIDAVATDHAPHTEVQKNSDIKTSPMGIVGFETALPLVVTNLVKKNYIGINRAIELLSSNPAKILKLGNQGVIKKGNISGLTVFNVDRKHIVKGSEFVSKSKITPFEGAELAGKVEFVVIDGKIYS